MSMRHTVKDFVRYNVKSNQLVRFICKPVMDLENRRIYEEYLRSPYPEVLRSYKSRYAGKRCFIIGNGPSLTVSDLELLKGEYTFAANRIYDMFDKTDWRPTFYVAHDTNFLEDNYTSIFAQKIDPSFLEYRSIRRLTPPGNVIGICREPYFPVNRWNDTTASVREELSEGFSEGYTVTFVSIQLAVYMGFTELYLLGVDFNYSVIKDERGKIHRDESVQDYFSGKKFNDTAMNYVGSLHAYETTKEYCDEHEITVKNATRGGKLEVFERVDLDELLN